MSMSCGELRRRKTKISEDKILKYENIPTVSANESTKRSMDLAEFLGALVEHNKKNGTYQVHLNSKDVEDNSTSCDVEFGDVYFTGCKTLQNTNLLSFDNNARKPVSQKEDGTPLYPSEINSSFFVDLTKVEHIEEVKDCADWFMFPSVKVVHLYMYPQNNMIDGQRNIVTIGFME